MQIPWKASLRTWLRKYYLWIVLVVAILLVAGAAVYLLLPEDQSVVKYAPIKPLNVITGPPESPLRKPVAIAVGLSGELYIVDSGNQRIAVINEDGRLAMSFGGPGSGRAELVRPQGIAVARNGNVYVADPGKGAVQVFDREGSYLYTIADKDKNSFQPLSVKADRSGDIYVFDNTIARFRVYDEKGERQKDFPAEKVSRLENIQALDIDPERNIVYGVEANKPQYLKMVNKNVTPQGDKKLIDPRGIIYNRSYQLVFISDAFLQKILVFNEGRYLGEFGGDGDGMNSFKRPAGLAFDEQGKLYVADTDNNRIVIYSY